MFGIFDVVAGTTVAVDLSPILSQLFLAVATAVIGFVGLAARNFINANKNNKNFGFLTDLAEVAVQAAEQLYGRQNGDDKKAYAESVVQAALEKQGIKVDVPALEAAIEAAVMREFNYPAAVEPATPPTETQVTMAGGSTDSTTDSE